MKLNLQDIKGITLGAVRVTQEDDGFHFFRFTEEQQALYKIRSEDFYNKTFCTSGVKFFFRTNSRFLKIKATVSTLPGSTRQFFAFDVFVNGQKIDSMNNYNDAETSEQFINAQLPMGEFKKEFSLGEGEKDVEVYLPWSVKAVVEEISLDDNAFVESIKPEKTLLCFGDSITQGYDALSPSCKYVTRLANFLDAQEYNKGIGGEYFFPELSGAMEEFVPDYITVAYGTNDWTGREGTLVRQTCSKFFANLTKSYPTSKIFVITPIWRKDYQQGTLFGEFHGMEKLIRELVEQYQNVKVVRGFELIPHDEKYFGDEILHPNNQGFEKYFENLLKEIESYL